MNFLKVYQIFSKNNRVPYFKLVELREACKPTSQMDPQVIDLVSSDDEVVEASAVIAGNFDAHVSLSSSKVCTMVYNAYIVEFYDRQEYINLSNSY